MSDGDFQKQERIQAAKRREAVVYGSVRECLLLARCGHFCTDKKPSGFGQERPQHLLE